MRGWSIRGLLHRRQYGDLRDLVFAPARRTAAWSAWPLDDTLLTRVSSACAWADVSQLPVLDGTRLVVVVIDESDLLLTVHTDPTRVSGTGRQRDDPGPHRPCRRRRAWPNCGRSSIAGWSQSLPMSEAFTD